MLLHSSQRTVISLNKTSPRLASCTSTIRQDPVLHSGSLPSLTTHSPLPPGPFPAPNALSMPTQPPQYFISLRQRNPATSLHGAQTSAGSQSPKRENHVPHLWHLNLCDRQQVPLPLCLPGPIPHPAPALGLGAGNCGIFKEASCKQNLPRSSPGPVLLPGRLITIPSALTASAYLSNEMQQVHPRFVCFCVCQFEQ